MGRTSPHPDQPVSHNPFHALMNPRSSCRGFSASGAKYRAVVYPPGTLPAMRMITAWLAVSRGCYHHPHR